MNLETLTRRAILCPGLSLGAISENDPRKLASLQTTVARQCGGSYSHEARYTTLLQSPILITDAIKAGEPVQVARGFQVYIDLISVKGMKVVDAETRKQRALNLMVVYDSFSGYILPMLYPFEPNLDAVNKAIYMALKDIGGALHLHIADLYSRMGYTFESAHMAVFPHPIPEPLRSEIARAVIDTFENPVKAPGRDLEILARNFCLPRGDEFLSPPQELFDLSVFPLWHALLTKDGKTRRFRTRRGTNNFTTWNAPEMSYDRILTVGEYRKDFKPLGIYCPEEILFTKGEIAWRPRRMKEYEEIPPLEMEIQKKRSEKDWVTIPILSWDDVADALIKHRPFGEPSDWDALCARNVDMKTRIDGLLEHYRERGYKVMGRFLKLRESKNEAEKV